MEKLKIALLPSCPLATLPSETLELTSLASHDMITHTKRFRDATP